MALVLVFTAVSDEGEIILSIEGRYQGAIIHDIEARGEAIFTFADP